MSYYVMSSRGVMSCHVMSCRLNQRTGNNLPSTPTPFVPFYLHVFL